MILSTYIPPALKSTLNSIKIQEGNYVETKPFSFSIEGIYPFMILNAEEVLSFLISVNQKDTKKHTTFITEIDDAQQHEECLTQGRVPTILGIWWYKFIELAIVSFYDRFNYVPEDSIVRSAREHGIFLSVRVLNQLFLFLQRAFDKKFDDISVYFLWENELLEGESFKKIIQVAEMMISYASKYDEQMKTLKDQDGNLSKCLFCIYR